MDKALHGHEAESFVLAPCRSATWGDQMAKQPDERKGRSQSSLPASDKFRQIKSGLKDILGSAKKAARTTLGDKALSEAQQRLSHASDAAEDTLEGLKTFARSATDGFGTAAKGVVSRLSFSKKHVADLQHNIEAQGGLYRELIRNRRTVDTVFLGGEAISVLLAGGHVAPEIIQAYEAAYPQMSQVVSFEDKVRSLDESALPGFLSAVKGKLFEQKYVAYLNSGNLPEGYEAHLATSTIQDGWDIAVSGPDPELVSVIQAKATDSVSYVVSAMKQNPAIDVVTTDEVYSHLVLSGISEGLVNSGFSNAELVASLEGAADAANIDFSWMPPWFTLAFIAFTSYKVENLTLYQRLELAGNRTGQAYLAYLIGGGVAALTNTWWLGVLASVSSRYLSEAGIRNAKLQEQLTKTYEANRRIIKRLRSHTGHGMRIS